jgi:hypothetical protein
VKKAWNILLGTAALVVALAAPGVARADESTDGWTWTDNGASVDGWSWSDAESPAPQPDGWSWGE